MTSRCLLFIEPLSEDVEGLFGVVDSARIRPYARAVAAVWGGCCVVMSVHQCLAEVFNRTVFVSPGAVDVPSAILAQALRRRRSDHGAVTHWVCRRACRRAWNAGTGWQAEPPEAFRTARRHGRQ